LDKANLGRHSFEFCFTRLVIQEISYKQLFRIAISFVTQSRLYIQKAFMIIYLNSRMKTQSHN